MVCALVTSRTRRNVRQIKLCLAARLEQETSGSCLPVRICAACAFGQLQCVTAPPQQPPALQRIEGRPVPDGTRVSLLVRVRA